MSEIISALVFIALPYSLFGYVARRIMTQRYYMTERPVTRNPRIGELNRRVYGNSKRNQSA